MKIGRQYLGKFCELTWRDPCATKYKSRKEDRSDVPKGRDALATWKEYGVIDDITDGVVRVIHSAGDDPPAEKEDRTMDFHMTYVPEDLVESVRLFVPEVLGEVK